MTIKAGSLQGIGDTFYVDGASDFSPDFPFSSESGPESNIRFKGTPVPVNITEIIAENGPRKPGEGGSQKAFNHLFVLITNSNHQPTAEEIAYLELVRAAWADYFYGATAGAATMDTLLTQ